MLEKPHCILSILFFSVNRNHSSKYLSSEHIFSVSPDIEFYINLKYVYGQAHNNFTFFLKHLNEKHLFLPKLLNDEDDNNHETNIGFFRLRLPDLSFFPLFFDFELAKSPPTIFSFLTTLFTALLKGAVCGITCKKPRNVLEQS